MTAGTPWFVLVAGINGAGKSTFAQDHATLRVLLDARGPEIEVINPDLITREIRRAEPELSLDEANVRAADECEQRVRDLVRIGERSFVIETVLSTEKYKPIVRAWRTCRGSGSTHRGRSCISTGPRSPNPF